MAENLQYTISLKDLFSGKIHEANINAKQFEQSLDIINRKTSDHTKGGMFDELSHHMFGAMTKANLFATAIEKGSELVVEGAKKMIESYQPFKEAYEEVMKGAEFATNEFFRTIREGDWSNLLDNLSEAVSRGMEYERVLNELKKTGRSEEAQYGVESIGLAKLEETIRNKSLPLDRRQEAGREWIETQQKHYESMTELAGDEYQANLNAFRLKEGEIRKMVELDAGDIKRRERAVEYNKILKEQKGIEDELRSAKAGKITGVTGSGTGGTNIEYGISKETINDYKKRLREIPEELNKYAPKDVALARLIQKTELGGITPEQLDNTIKSFNKYNQSLSAFYRENKRIKNMLNQMLGLGENGESLGGLGAGLSEPKNGKIQQITINMSNFQNGLKIESSSMEMGADDFMGKLSQTLNKVILDASIVATE